MNRRTHEAIPLQEAIGLAEPLERLRQRIQASQARFDVVRPLLPPALADQVRAGPLDDTSWTLLVPHGAAAAKLRQYQPALQQALQAKGWERTAIRIRIQAASR